MSNLTATKLSELQFQCDSFNRLHPVGTKVIVAMDSGEQRETYTVAPAEVLGGHSAVIWMNGVRGCYRLDRVRALP